MAINVAGKFDKHDLDYRIVIMTKTGLLQKFTSQGPQRVFSNTYAILNEKDSILLQQ